MRYLALQTMCASASATAFFVLGGAAAAAGWRVPFRVYAVSLLLAPVLAFAHLDAGRHPEDPRLASLIGELSMKSEDFRRWWAEHPVRDKTSGTKRFHHPVVGDLELAYETLRAADDPEQALITYAAEPGSASHDALRMLLAWATDGHSRAPAEGRAR